MDHNLKKPTPIQVPTLVVSWLKQEYVYDPKGIIQKAKLYEAYEEFCRQQALRPRPPNTFGKILRQIFPHIQTKRLGSHRCQVTYYEGISPKGMVGQFREEFLAEMEQCGAPLTPQSFSPQPLSPTQPLSPQYPVSPQPVSPLTSMQHPLSGIQHLDPQQQLLQLQQLQKQIEEQQQQLEKQLHSLNLHKEQQQQPQQQPQHPQQQQQSIFGGGETTHFASFSMQQLAPQEPQPLPQPPQFIHPPQWPQPLPQISPLGLFATSTSTSSSLSLPPIKTENSYGGSPNPSVPAPIHSPFNGSPFNPLNPYHHPYALRKADRGGGGSGGSLESMMTDSKEPEGAKETSWDQLNRFLSQERDEEMSDGPQDGGGGGGGGSMELISAYDSSGSLFDKLYT